MEDLVATVAKVMVTQATEVMATIANTVMSPRLILLLEEVMEMLMEMEVMEIMEAMEGIIDRDEQNFGYIHITFGRNIRKNYI